MAEALMQTRVIRGSRKQAAVIFTVAAVCAAVVALAWQAGERHWWLALLAVVAGLFLVVSLLLIFRPLSLVLSGDGFEWRDVWGRRHAVKWRWIEEMAPWNMGLTNSKGFIVAYKLRPDAPVRAKSSFDHGLTGIDGCLPGPLQVTPEELLAITQQYHRAATASPRTL